MRAGIDERVDRRVIKKPPFRSPSEMAVPIHSGEEE
jgi:hypothetical protein